MTQAEDGDVIVTGAPFPKIDDVAALDGFAVRVMWRGRGEPSVVDLGPVILTYAVFAPLRDDRALFESVRVVNPSVIAWGDDDGIDMHVLEIERIEGEAMTGFDFQAFLDDTGLTWDGAAAQLGLSRRTVGYYVKATRIPRVVALACAHLRGRWESGLASSKSGSPVAARGR